MPFLFSVSSWENSVIHSSGNVCIFLENLEFFRLVGVFEAVLAIFDHFWTLVKHFGFFNTHLATFIIKAIFASPDFVYFHFSQF